MALFLSLTVANKTKSSDLVKERHFLSLTVANKTKSSDLVKNGTSYH